MRLEQCKIDELKSAIADKDTLKVHTIVDQISFFELMELCGNTFISWIKKKFKMTRNRSLFKNDSFGIKYKMFMRRLTHNIKKRNHMQARILECLLNLSMGIGIPESEEEIAKLEWIYDKYKSLISEVENDMKRVHNKIYDWRND